MAPYAPTYRYVVGIFGANYSRPESFEPSHWYMAQTLNDVRHVLYMRAGNWRIDEHEMADGTIPLDTPNYGEPGDGAYIYRVNREHPDFSEVLDEPGDRARHAFGFVDFDIPAYMASFGPRGGIRIERAV